MTEKFVLQMVQDERKTLPQLGGKKLYFKVHPSIKEANLRFGRDKLFKLLGDNDLLIKRKRSYIQTTNSKHWLKKYPNITKGFIPSHPEQLWVTDITYIKTDEGYCYLNLVTDAYSRKIMGYSVSDNMETNSIKNAYKMALQNRNYQDQKLIHHSDRGLQYCSNEYVKLSEKNNIKISMTENGDPYENALAERMNKTIKEEFGLGKRLPTRQQAFRMVEEAVHLYNNLRPHWALNLQTPQTVHLQKIPTT